MALQDDIKEGVTEIFRDQWSVRDGTVVPQPDSVRLNNDAVRLEGTVLYADLSESTRLVDKEPPEFAAEIYKAYLRTAARIIATEGGEITAYDGDRIMAVFIGKAKNTTAVRCGLKINWARQHIINPALKAQYSTKTYQLKQTVGIDTSTLFIARTGIRGANDLVWVGRAANHAAKLSGLSADSPTWISEAVYDGMHESAKFTDGKSMWQERRWTQMDDARVYCSTWVWPV
jgi:class 3 adenylate cyclase